jgi:hypothetical protein
MCIGTIRVPMRFCARPLNSFSKAYCCGKVKPRTNAQPWKCYFGYHLYASLQTVVFVVQHLFDEAQIMADNVRPPVHGDQWQYIYRLGLHMKQSLATVSAVFAPACLSHILLMGKEWNLIDVNGVNLASALNCMLVQARRRPALLTRWANG